MHFRLKKVKNWVFLPINYKKLREINVQVFQMISLKITKSVIPHKNEGITLQKLKLCAIQQYQSISVDGAIICCYGRYEYMSFCECYINTYNSTIIHLISRLVIE